MRNPGEAGARRPSRLAASVVWLLVIAGLATILRTVAPAPNGSERRQAETERPFAQAASDDGSSPIWLLAFSPDGTCLASATLSGEVRLKNLVSGHRRLIQRGPTSAAQCLRFSSDGRILAVGGYESALHLYDAESGTEVEPLEPEPDSRAIRVAFSRDGKYMALMGTEGTLALWDWRSRHKLTTLAGLHGHINDLTFSPDGSALATCDSSGHVLLWSIPSGKELTPPHDEQGISVSRHAFSPDGTMFATISYPVGPVRLWTRAGDEIPSALPTQGVDVRALAFSPDGSLLAMVGQDGVATLWGIAKGRALGTLRANGRGLLSVAFSSDGRTLATGGADGSVRLWNVAQVLAGPRPARRTLLL